MQGAELELWGGIECTVNRVDDHYFDQIKMSGHETRAGDLERFAALGIKTLRFPVLWERMAPDAPDQIDWTWSDARLSEARALGLEVIIGFVHHGSGPRYTHLLDAEFPEKLAIFAGLFAARYPWVSKYTPVNEPLTTARFSGLYGIWYPHERSSESFLRMLQNECRAIAAAMRAVRKVQPEAQLVQTEDLGRVFSTPFLSYQAKFENQRRWLSFDLLCGRIDFKHPLWKFCVKHGLKPAELEAWVDDPCPPDIMGINHYITSNRFLDERLERYPPSSYGGNRRHRYADVEAVRVGAENLCGPREILLEAWERYRIPLAITEVHMGCTREEQMRWLHEVWSAADGLRREGYPLRAVTVWSLLGSFDWASLVTRNEGLYETGVFDVRPPEPRPTALASLVKSLSRGETFDHPVLDAPGWWHRSHRLLYPAVPMLSSGPSVQVPPDNPNARPILITGAPGSLATAFAFACERRGLAYQLLSKAQLDAANEEEARARLKAINPWAVINAAGYRRVDLAEKEPDACFRSNVQAPTILAKLCADRSLPFMTFSSDLVFDGTEVSPYLESNPVGPLSVYGHSKAQAETQVLYHYADALIIRSSAFFGPWDEVNFLTRTLRQLARGKSIAAAGSFIVSPTYVPDLVDASLDLMIDGAKGIWHLTNQGALSWAEFASLGASRFHFDPQLIRASSSEDLGWLAPRPSYSVLGSDRGLLLPPLEHALDRYVRECRVAVT